MINYDVIRKAILFESSYILNEKHSDLPGESTTLQEVLLFYTQLRECFSIKFDTDELFKDILSIDEERKFRRTIHLWSQENNILMFKDRDHMYYFTNEEDAMAFKLRWT